MIVIKPTGGLANRMRAIDSALSLGAAIDHRVHILWTLLPECNCSFEALFRLPAFATLEERKGHLLWDRLPRHLRFGMEWAGCALRNDKILFQNRIVRLKQQDFDFTSLRSCRRIYIRCCNRFFYPERKFEHIIPAEVIQREVEEIVHSFPPSTTGVHIRRTDHVKAIEHNPPEWFIKAMRKVIEQDPSAVFFLATDDPEEESRMKEVFGSRIMTRSKELDRNNPSGIQDALVDLLCLSRTNRIIGSLHSSFSSVAAQVGQIRLVTP